MAVSSAKSIGVATYLKVGGGDTYEGAERGVWEGCGRGSPSQHVENFSFSRTLK